MKTCLETGPTLKSFGFSWPLGTATSTVRTSVLSYSDYISRPEDHSSVVRFDKDEREKMCRVVIIDDSLYEEEETFQVLLSMPMGGRIGDKFPGSKVTILTDKDDGEFWLILWWQCQTWLSIEKKNRNQIEWWGARWFSAGFYGD